MSAKPNAWHTNGKALATLPEPTEAQQQRLAEARRKVAARGKRIGATLNLGGSARSIGADHADQDGWADHLQDACGTSSTTFASTLLGEIEWAVRQRQSEPGEASADRLTAALAAMDGIAPVNEAEAMLAAQMVGTHALAMEMLARSRHSPHLETTMQYGALATKMLRTYTAQAEALARIRRGGEQIVKHVYVGPGGQAIVGSVNYQGGGGNNGNSSQPYASDPRALDFAPGLPVWGEDEARDAMSVAGSEGTQAMPAARRRTGKRSPAGNP